MDVVFFLGLGEVVVRFVLVSGLVFAFVFGCVSALSLRFLWCQCGVDGFVT